jgi:hypothetical protein
MTETVDRARAFLATLEVRDWDGWAALLSPDVVYEMPQTRERIRGRDRYLRFNVTYPGDWHLSPKVVIGDDARAVLWFDWRIGDDESGQAQVFLEFDGNGLITRVTDFWPEPYDPPERTDPSLFERW